MNRQNLQKLTLAAFFGAIAFILMFFNFSVPVLSPFAEFDLSALPELIGGFILGPVGAVEIIVVKLGLKLLFQGSESMLTGELSNLMLSLAYVLPAVIYYRRNRTKKGALIGIIIGFAATVILSVFTNIFIIFPFYIKLYGMNWQGILDIFSAVNPWIKDIPTMIAFSIIPFNVISRAVTAVITLLVYKKISIPLKKFIKQ